ncbi:MAG: hypothetical protein AAFQ94_28445, partial [Bacteroidota bacterium]
TLATLVLLLTTTFAAYSNTIFDEDRLQLRMKDGMIQMLLLIKVLKLRVLLLYFSSEYLF